MTEIVCIRNRESMDEIDRAMALSARLRGVDMAFLSPISIAESVTTRLSEDDSTVDVIPDRPLLVREFSFSASDPDESFLAIEVSAHVRAIAAMSKSRVINRPGVRSMAGDSISLELLDGIAAFGRAAVWWTGICRSEIYTSELSEALVTGSVIDSRLGRLYYRSTISDQATGPYRAREGTLNDDIANIIVVGQRTWTHTEMLSRQFGLAYLSIWLARSLSLDYVNVGWRASRGDSRWISLESLSVFPSIADVGSFSAEVGDALVGILAGADDA